MSCVLFVYILSGRVCENPIAFLCLYVLNLKIY
nr:MAG TPA: hypothetical protein [Caudoviricetes sp.]